MMYSKVRYYFFQKTPRVPFTKYIGYLSKLLWFKNQMAIQCIQWRQSTAHRYQKIIGSTSMIHKMPQSSSQSDFITKLYITSEESRHAMFRRLFDDSANDPPFFHFLMSRSDTISSLDDFILFVKQRIWWDHHKLSLFEIKSILDFETQKNNLSVRWKLLIDEYSLCCDHYMLWNIYPKRKLGDSNPGLTWHEYTLSKRAHSTTLPSFHRISWTYLPSPFSTDYKRQLQEDKTTAVSSWDFLLAFTLLFSICNQRQARQLFLSKKNKESEGCSFIKYILKNNNICHPEFFYPDMGRGRRILMVQQSQWLRYFTSFSMTDLLFETLLQWILKQYEPV